MRPRSGSSSSLWIGPRNVLTTGSGDGAAGPGWGTRATEMGVGSGKVRSSPCSAPLTYKDGTALALSCMADYGAPVFPFLAVGGYKGKLGGPQEDSEGTYGAGVKGRRMGVAKGFLLPGGGCRPAHPLCFLCHPVHFLPALPRFSGSVPGPIDFAFG